MRKIIRPIQIFLLLQLIALGVYAKKIDSAKNFGDPPKSKTNGKVIFFREAPGVYSPDPADTVKKESFKPSIQVGSIVHMFFSSQQYGYGNPNAVDGEGWSKNFNLYRARILLGGQLSKNGSFFMETDIASPVGILLDPETKNVKVSPILLDVQYEHKFGRNHMVVAGMQLVSHNRNGLQGAAALMANDFTYFQYPYNLFANSPLQGNFGRDLGVNLRGFFLKDKLEYRLGMFSGKRFTNDSPFRYVGRVVYNFLDPEKDYYYAGTKLGGGRTIALGAGFDTQTTYSNVGADLFIDLPAGPGAVTLNTAYSKMTGGNDPTKKYSFTGMIPTQSVQFLELGYYFSGPKIQPWIRYENQAFASESNQTEGIGTDVFDDLNSATVFGGGINYFFNGYGTNVRMSYTTWSQNDTSLEKKSYGQVWLQLQFFLF